MLVTRTVQLDERRNPGWDEAEVEAELARTIGAERVIWLPRGLTRDYDEFGTRGHVDIVATFARRAPCSSTARRTPPSRPRGHARDRRAAALRDDGRSG